MSRKSTKEKKLRRQKNKEEQVKTEELKFDVISLLKTESLETKPEVGEFLKKYVKTIRILNENSKITIYPIQEYSVCKVFVDFFDGKQIIAEFLKTPRQYYMYDGVEEIILNDKDLKYVVNLIQKLQEFSFIH